MVARPALSRTIGFVLAEERPTSVWVVALVDVPAEYVNSLQPLHTSPELLRYCTAIAGAWVPSAKAPEPARTRARTSSLRIIS